MDEPRDGRAAPRVEAARRRAGVAKLAFGAAAVVAFAVSATLARASFAGKPHRRAHTRALSAPADFVQAVQQNQLQAGSIAPPQEPPQVATSSS